MVLNLAAEKQVFKNNNSNDNKKNPRPASPRGEEEEKGERGPQGVLINHTQMKLGQMLSSFRPTQEAENRRMWM